MTGGDASGLPDADATRAYGRALAGVLRAGRPGRAHRRPRGGQDDPDPGDRRRAATCAGRWRRRRSSSRGCTRRSRARTATGRRSCTSTPTGSGSLEEVDALDLDASLDEPVTVVEWGEGLVEALAQDRLEVTLQRPRGGALTDDDLDDAAAGERVVTVRAVGARWADVALPDADPVAG